MERIPIQKKIDQFVDQYIDSQSPNESLQLLQAFIEAFSVRQLSKVTDIDRRSLYNYLHSQGISIPTQAEASRQMLAQQMQDPEFRARNAEGVRRNWQDPEFRARNAEASRQMLAQQMQDPEFRARQAEGVRQKWQDPEFRARRAEASRQMLAQQMQDPEFRARNAEAIRQKWQDPEFRARNAEAIRQKWQDPEFRARNAKGVRRNWQDPEFRARRAEGVRQARSNPQNIQKYFLPTIQGDRQDVGYTQSTWEANLYRILRLTNRDFSTQFKLELTVPDEYRSSFSDDHTDFYLDSLSIDPRGRFVGHEIMAHPSKNPLGWIKLELAIVQYPEIIFRQITQKTYNRLKRRFAHQINQNPYLAGWETYEDNLKTNPAKYS